MWNEAVSSTLFKLPCRFSLNSELGTLPQLIIGRIEQLYRNQTTYYDPVGVQPQFGMLYGVQPQVSALYGVQPLLCTIL